MAMLKQDEISSLSSHVRNSQIICFALIAGVLGFLGITFVVIPIADLNQDLSLLVYVGLFVAIATIAISIALPRAMRQALAKSAAERLKQKKKVVDDQATILDCAQQFLTINIVRSALLESAGFLNLIIFFVEHSVVSVAIAGATILLMAVGFPTTSRALNWIESQLELVRDYSRSQS